MKSQEHLVRNALKGNALFSLLSGAALIFFGPYLKELFATSLLFWPVGALLALFALLVARAAFSEVLPHGQIRLIVGMDLVWVVGSGLLLLLAPDMPVAGKWVVAIVAVLVADFAVFQYLGLRRATSRELV